MEIWKDVKGYENLYMVSNLGRIKSIYHKTEKILKDILPYYIRFHPQHASWEKLKAQFFQTPY